MEQYTATDSSTTQTGRRLRSDALQKLEWPILGLLVLAALAIRLYGLGSFPDTVLADEADNAQDSVRILHGQPPVNGIFGVDWTPQPAFSIYKGAAFLALFGFNILALRLPSALISVLALLPFYALLRRQFSHTTSLLAVVLLGTNVWFLNFSRSGWNNIDVCFYMLMAMLFLMRALDSVQSPAASLRKTGSLFGVAGLFCALGLYAYPSGRAVTLAVAAFLPLALLFHRRQARTVFTGFVLLFTVEAVLFAPQAYHALRNWEFFNGRTNVVLIFNSPEYQSDPSGTMLRQLERNVLGPWNGQVNNTPQYFPVGEPQLDRLTGTLTLAGMSLSLLLAAYRRRPETWLWWLMLLSGWFLTQILTTSTPNGARGVGYMPALVYFAAVGLDGLVRLLNEGIRKIGISPFRARVARGLSGLLLTALVVFTGYANVKHYVDWQDDPRTRQARYLYVTAREFPEWSAAIVDLARTNGNKMNVGQWREAHPIADTAHP